MKDIPVVQIGSPSDPLLEGVADFRSIGFPIRICASIIKNALTGVFLEGGLMHLSNALNKPSIIIFGGALRPEITGYDLHTNISVKLDCGPCFTSDKPMGECPTMKCMQSITPELIFEHLKTIIS